MTDETRELATFAATLTHEQIPQHARARALDLLVDQLGCEIGCCELPWAKQVRNTYRKFGGVPEATTVAYGDRLPVISAAYINSTFGHSFDYDDSNHLTRGHAGAELIPALMAIAERDHVSGRDFLTALIATYEVRGRIGWAVSRKMVQQGGPHPSTACGPFGVAAGVGRLLGLGAEGIMHAFGIAGCYSGGLMQYSRVGGSAKRIVPAVAASSGIQAAYLAQAGMTGPEEILEGDCGLMRIFAQECLPERLVADLGKMWTIEHAFFKLYSCNGNIHPAIDCLKHLISAHDLKADSIESVTVSYPKSHYKVISVATPRDFLGMQFSTSYCLAVTMLKGRNSPREYTMDALADPEIRAFAAKVAVQEDAELSHMAEAQICEPARVKVVTKSGEVHVETRTKGTTAKVSAAEIDNKFRSQVVDVLGAERCENVLRAIRDIDALDDMAKLPPMLVIQDKENTKWRHPG